MKTRFPLLLAVLCCIPLAGCTIARQLTTRGLDFTENLIPDRNGGKPYSAVSDTGGPIGPLPFNIQITGEVRDKFDRYHGGVDWAYLSYRAVNTAKAPARVRLWATLSDSINHCPVDNNDATLILDVTLPPNQTVEFRRGDGSNIEELRRIVEALLRAPETSAACVYVQAECADVNGIIRLEELNVEGRAHGSLF